MAGVRGGESDGSATVMVCLECGAAVVEGQAFCTQCGVSLRGVTDTTRPVATQPIAPVQPAASDARTARTPITDLQITELSAPVEPAPYTADTVRTPVSEPTGAQTAAPPPGGITRTQEITAIFDGHDDLGAFPDPREPFKVRFVFIASFLGAIAALMSALGDVVDIRTTRPAAGIATGISTLDDIGSNLGPGGLIGAATMVIGGLLACFGLRWGAGLAGGAGLALAGWSVLTIGLVEVPVAVAESITRTSSGDFTLTVTRDVGWWLVVTVGAIGVIVFLASLRAFRRAGHRPLNPLLAAVGAVCALVLAAGPLVPVGGATLEDNVRSPTATIDLPTILFAGRLAQVGLIAFAGVIGFLLVRSYGLGLAAGSVSVAVWLWVTSILELGSQPVGVADRNPGSLDTIPHGVTTVGVVTTVVVLLLAAIVAVVGEMNARPD
jgi:hypothetical protein